LGLIVAVRLHLFEERRPRERDALRLIAYGAQPPARIDPAVFGYHA
jgi:hypothetical protein